MLRHLDARHDRFGLKAPFRIARGVKTAADVVTSSLGIAPAMLLAGEAAFVDLDGPLWLADDRTGGVVDRGGMLSPPASGFWGTPA